MRAHLLQALSFLHLAQQKWYLLDVDVGRSSNVLRGQSHVHILWYLALNPCAVYAVFARDAAHARRSQFQTTSNSVVLAHLQEVQHGHPLQAVHTPRIHLLALVQPRQPCHHDLSLQAHHGLTPHSSNLTGRSPRRHCLHARILALLHLVSALSRVRTRCMALLRQQVSADVSQLIPNRGLDGLPQHKPTESGPRQHPLLCRLDLHLHLKDALTVTPVALVLNSQCREEHQGWSGKKAEAKEA